MGVYDVSIIKDRRLFGINTNLRIDHKSIPYTVHGVGDKSLEFELRELEQ